MMKSLKQLLRRGRQFLISPLVSGETLIRPDAAAQLQLKLQYRALLNSGSPLPRWSDVGLKIYSQTDEDGILLYIFSVIGEQSRRCVELCAGDGIECNTANLIINHGWTGLLLDGNAQLVNQGIRFYQRQPNCFVFPPKFLHAWVTRQNVNTLLRQAGFEGEADLLSLDLDGVDYWIWDALEVVQPRVVVLEYNDILGPERAVTVPYADQFNAYDHPTTEGLPNYCGASLPAFVKLGRKKGYRFVGCNRYGFNAFFVKEALAKRELPECSIASCFDHPKVKWGLEHRFPLVKHLYWEEV